MKDFVLVGAQANLDGFLRLIGAMDVKYLVVETDYTTNHFEKLLGSCSDRGSFKWIAETNMTAYEENMQDPRAHKAKINGSDLFPRLYFYADCLVKEFRRWCAIRQQDIQKITVPIEYSPMFNGEFHMKVMSKILGDDEC
jgi:hypothetical protein